MAEETAKTKKPQEQISPVPPVAAAANDDIIVVEERPTISEPLADKIWLVSDGEGRTGKVKAKTASSAKYAFMRARGIIDMKQQWTVKELGETPYV